MALRDDLLAVSEMASGLWAESGRADEAALETFSALVLQNLTPERRAIKLVATLLGRASRDGSAAAARLVNDPFYRLDPEERILLIGLYRSKWSYGRLSQVLEEPLEKVQELAWAARLHLAYAVKQPGPVSLVHPTGSPLKGASCPPYHPGRPWTQRYLDQECLPQERFFFEAHSRDCTDCRKALERARTLYYWVESLVPKPGLEAEARCDRLIRFYEKAADWQSPLGRSFARTLLIFLQRTEAQLALSVLIVLMGYWTYLFLF